MFRPRFASIVLLLLLVSISTPGSVSSDTALGGAVVTRLSGIEVEMLGYDGNEINFSVYFNYYVNNTGPPVNITTPCVEPYYEVNVTSKFPYTSYSPLPRSTVCLTAITTHTLGTGVYLEGNYTILLGLRRGSYLIYYFNELASEFYGLRIQVLNAMSGLYRIDEDVQVTKEPFKDFTDFMDQYSTSSDVVSLAEEYILWQSLYGFPAIINDTAVAFIYYEKLGSVSSVQLAGDFNGWSPEPMSRLDPSLNLFYKVMTFNSTARLDYKFVVDGQWVLDPRNYYTMPGGFGDNSELAMPKFQQPSEVIYRKDIPHGVVRQFSTSFSNYNPAVHVYVPPNYNESQSYPVAYFTDGTEYRMFASAVNVLDNLIYDGELEPLIAVFIDPWGQRHEWYNCSSPVYVSYLDQLLSVLEAEYSINSSRRLHLGDSLGGQISLYVGIKRPELFKYIGTQSGAFWDGDSFLGRIGCDIKTQFQELDDSTNLKLWMTAGYFEETIYQDTATIAQSALEKGWKHEARYFHEGHSWGLWRHTLSSLLTYFFPAQEEVSPPMDTTSSSTTKVVSSTSYPSSSPPSSSSTQRQSPFFSLVVFVITVPIWWRRRRRKEVVN